MTYIVLRNGNILFGSYRGDMYICDIDTENLILIENNIPTLDIN